MNKLDITKLEIVKQDKKRAWIFCPAHNDKHKSNLCITLTDDYYGSYFCFACGFHGVLSKREMETLKLKKQKKTQLTNINWMKLVMEYCNNSTSHILVGRKMEELCTEWNVSRESIEDFLIGWDREAHTAPMCNACFEVIGIQKRFPDGSKCCVEGSQLGLFIPTGFKQRTQESLFICEGLSDAVSIYDLGFMAIGRPNCNLGNEYIKDYIIHNNIQEVVLIPDNDKAGIDGANKLDDVIWDYTEAESATFYIPYSGAKDIRIYIAMVGKSRVQKELQECIR